MIFNQINRFDDTEHEAMMGVWWSGILLKQQAKSFFRIHPVSDSQFNAMMTLKYAEKELSQQELSERLLVDKSNMTSMIDGLEKLGFVTRNQQLGDLRFYRLLLTESGAAFLDGIEKDYRALIHRMLAHFSPDEMKQLTQFMVRLQTNLDKETRSAASPSA